MAKKKKNKVSWYNVPEIITDIIMILVLVILVVSQSFATSSNLSAYAVFRSVVNHNLIYLLVLMYFILLKFTIGKKYFNYLNIFLLILYFINTITSCLSIFQSISLISILTFVLNLIIFIYLIHIFLKKTVLWKNFKLKESPFNDISNDSYYYIIIILSMLLLAINLIEVQSFRGISLIVLDFLYTVFFARYVYLYGAFINKTKLKDFESFGETLNDLKNATDDIIDDVRDTADNIADDIADNIESKTKPKKKPKKKTKKGDK